MRTEFFMAMARVPTATHQEKSVRVAKGKPQFYEPDNVKAARAKLTAHLARHKPEKPLRGAVRLVVKWCYPRGKTHRNGEYRTSRPDTDNLQKLLKDCMTAVGFWKNDAQVASEICEKFWADVPGVYVCAEEIAEPEKVRDKNPCLNCDCRNGTGCTMPPSDREYACDLYADEAQVRGDMEAWAKLEGAI